MKIDRDFLDVDNRMLRLGVGKNKGRWFGRIDLWSIWFRVSSGVQKESKPKFDMDKHRAEVYARYMKWVDEVSEDLEDKTHFTPEEIVSKVLEISLDLLNNKSQ